VHSPAVAARLGVALGVAMTLCMITGLLSHYLQHPPAWLSFPARPVSGFRVTQGVHVLSGLAILPLLIAKLWTVYPKLFQRPVIRSAEHGLERLFVFLLVGGTTFEVVTGIFDIAAYYPWRFSFVAVHFAVAWIVYGALVIHVAHQWVTAREALAERLPRESYADGLSRRGFLGATAAATGAVVIGFAGQTITPLRRVSPFATHIADVGPQALPVRKSASGAQVIESAMDPAYRLRVHGAVARELMLTVDELRALPQSTARLPIACVEGWSAVGTWSGVSLRELVALAGGRIGAPVRVTSLQRGGSYRSSVVDPPHSRDVLTLLALRLNGADLHIDHGFPCRLVAANRPGVMQTKWVSDVEVLA
jgi:DMSO/TMAO reductase YedYZ molybdopterin-dependent catalytic subunit